MALKRSIISFSKTIATKSTTDTVTSSAKSDLTKTRHSSSLLPSFLLRTRPGLIGTVLAEVRRRLHADDSIKAYSLSSRFVGIQQEFQPQSQSKSQRNSVLLHKLLRVSRVSEGIFWCVGAVKGVRTWERLEEVLKGTTQQTLTNSYSNTDVAAAVQAKKKSKQQQAEFSHIRWQERLFDTVYNDKNPTQLGLQVRIEESPLWEHNRIRTLVRDNLEEQWKRYLEEKQENILSFRQLFRDSLGNSKSKSKQQQQQNNDQIGPTLLVELFGENLIVGLNPFKLRITPPRSFVYSNVDDKSMGHKFTVLQPIPTPFRIGSNGEMIYAQVQQDSDPNRFDQQDSDYLNVNSMSQSSSATASKSWNPLPTPNSRFDLIETKKLMSTNVNPMSMSSQFNLNQSFKSTLSNSSPPKPTLTDTIFSEWHQSHDLPPHFAAACVEYLWPIIESNPNWNRSWSKSSTNLIWDPFCCSGGVIGTEIAAKALGLPSLRRGGDEMMRVREDQENGEGNLMMANPDQQNLNGESEVVKLNLPNASSQTPDTSESLATADPTQQSKSNVIDEQSDPIHINILSSHSDPLTVHRARRHAYRFAQYYKTNIPDSDVGTTVDMDFDKDLDQFTVKLSTKDSQFSMQQWYEAEERRQNKLQQETDGSGPDSQESVEKDVVKKKSKKRRRAKKNESESDDVFSDRILDKSNANMTQKQDLASSSDANTIDSTEADVESDDDSSSTCSSYVTTTEPSILSNNVSKRKIRAVIRDANQQPFLQQQARAITTNDQQVHRSQYHSQNQIHRDLQPNQPNKNLSHHDFLHLNPSFPAQKIPVIVNLSVQHTSRGPESMIHDLPPNTLLFTRLPMSINSGVNCNRSQNAVYQLNQYLQNFFHLVKSRNDWAGVYVLSTQSHVKGGGLSNLTKCKWQPVLTWNSSATNSKSKSGNQVTLYKMKNVAGNSAIVPNTKNMNHFNVEQNLSEGEKKSLRIQKKFEEKFEQLMFDDLEIDEWGME